MKKVLLAALVLVLALAPAAARDWNIQLITMDQMDQHWANVDKGAQKAVEELGGINYRWNAPSIKDDSQQIECINNAIAQGADAILLAANGPDAVTATLREAESYGIKIIYIDSPANFPAEATFATNNVAAGTTAGNEMIKALEAKGITSGTIGIVSVNTATQSTVDREAGFRAAFEGTGFTLLETQYCMAMLPDQRMQQLTSSRRVSSDSLVQTRVLQLVLAMLFMKAALTSWA